jgi:hypothetical protein
VEISKFGKPPFRAGRSYSSHVSVAPAGEARERRAGTGEITVVRTPAPAAFAYGVSTAIVLGLLIA